MCAMCVACGLVCVRGGGWVDVLTDAVRGKTQAPVSFAPFVAMVANSINRAPTITKNARVPLTDISTSRPSSGWRDPCPERIMELTQAFYNGQWCMHLFGDVVLLSTLDTNGKRLIDDGMSTVKSPFDERGV